ncbi:MAG: hypothetical protein FJ102_14600 [Deltaproteobacteria bacterium]|nr:hypothetical protein [Deltaproteobacteria bacterium]
MVRIPFALAVALLAGCPAIPEDDDTDKPGDSAEDTAPEAPVDADNDGSPATEDCDDNDAANYPGGTEACDGVDNDCDGEADEGAGNTWYADADGDGYGDESAFKTDCTQPAGYVADATDCNDADALYHPGADESACTSADPDYNCNGSPDTADLDGDSYDSCRDCDDFDSTSFPGNPEACDGADNDCNGTIDDGTGASRTYYEDADRDGFGNVASPLDACAVPDGYAANDDDCDDADGAVNPGEMEVCNDVDDDCDGEADESAAADAATWYRDGDSDGYGDPRAPTDACDQPTGYVANATDCDDGDSGVFPAAEEFCGGVDHDCDGAVNEADSIDIADYYSDSDGDGYAGTFAGEACEAPPGTSFSATDCDDADADINPSAEDTCDDVDNDCDGLTDFGLRVPTDYVSIQDAIDASADGETVCVASGDYYETIDFNGRDITVQGEGSTSTTIDGSGTGPVVRIASGETGAALRGVGITGGVASTGAGLYISGTSPVLDDLYVYGNTCNSTSCYGTGGYIYGSPTMTDVTVAYNYATPSSTSYLYVFGTGLYLSNHSGTIDNLTIYNNGADISNATSYGLAYGAGLHATGCYADFTDTEVAYNYSYHYTSSTGRYAYSYGAGMYLYNGASSFDGLDLYGNAAYLYSNLPQAHGTGAYLSYDDSSFNHAKIYSNSVIAYASYGTAIFAAQYSEPSFTNCIVAANQTLDYGYFSYVYAYGLFYTSDYANPTLTNCDIVGNTLDGYAAYGGMAYMGAYGDLTVENTSVYKNSLSARYNFGGAVYLGSTSYAGTLDSTYSNWYGNTTTEFVNVTTPVGSNGNGAVSPGYSDTSSSDAAYWDLTLSASSSLVNAGDPSVYDTDGSRSDVGAYGGPGGAW